MTQAVKARGRAKSEEKHQQILKAATALFLDCGYTGVSMEQISEAAGVSKQTLYSHFGGKEGLFMAAVECGCMEHAISEELFNDQLPVRQVLRDTAEHFMDLLLSDSAVRVHRLICAEAEQYPEVARLFFDAGPRKLLTWLTEYLERLQQEGRVSVDDAYFAASQFLFMVKGEAQMRAVLNYTDPQVVANLSAYLDSCVDLFIKAYQVVER